MAILKTDTKQVEVSDGDSIIDACEELGVPFGCTSGVCGTCMTTVLEGMENLCERTENEVAMGVSPPERLMCQCYIKEGVVTLST